MAKDYRPIGYGAPRAARAPLVGSRAPRGYGWGRFGGWAMEWPQNWGSLVGSSARSILASHPSFTGGHGVVGARLDTL